jgi:hypothetical protein
MFSWCHWLDRVRSPRVRRRGTGDSLALDTLVQTSRRLTQISLMERSVFAAAGEPISGRHRRGDPCSVTSSAVSYSGNNVHFGGQLPAGTAASILTTPSLSSISSKEESPGVESCRLIMTTTETSPASGSDRFFNNSSSLCRQLSPPANTLTVVSGLRVKNRCGAAGQHQLPATAAGGQQLPATAVGGWRLLERAGGGGGPLSRSIKARRGRSTARQMGSGLSLGKTKGLDRRVSSV